ncbi:MAG: sugar O-acyltransferase, sialic acid O-acetyltransferase NeuD family [uncultured bacterium]|nr:MAG: sugar O-acyltransferase, sialic acid O-acetyltransferase NeuD family [uncultured bacterium]OGT55281.1 MAG: sugar O-acyltransferase [Gammaproteobacteria bacterium RIFCSPHIGHO2_12_FULL_42_10]
MNKTKKLIIFGDKSYAEIVYEYFTHDSEYEVVAFTVEQEYLTKNTFCHLPVVPFESINTLYSPTDFSMHVAIVYGKLNRIRENICKKAKDKGYQLVTYVSSRAFVWHNARIGENCFVFENNTIQPFVEIKNNVVLWSGNHIGHGSIIENNCFVSSHVVVSGFCHISSNCFLGVNSTIGNHVTVGANTWVSPGAIMTRDVPENSLVKGVRSKSAPLNEELLFRTLANYAE